MQQLRDLCESNEEYVLKAVASSIWKKQIRDYVCSRCLEIVNPTRKRTPFLGTMQTIYSVQSIFPAKPIYMATCEIVTINKPAEMKEKPFIKVAVQSLNEVCQKEFHHNFIDSLLSCQPGIELQKTRSEKKAERRKIMMQCRDACNKELEITTPVTLLRENDSLSGYARKRLSQYFEKPPSAKRRQQSMLHHLLKSHGTSKNSWMIYP